jgi:hypothetical protein
MAERLKAAGVPHTHQTILVGSAATRSAIESRLRRLTTSLPPADAAVWFIFAGPAFHEHGRGFLACADTLADDRAATAVAVADVVRLLGTTPATVRVLLDAPGLSDDELEDLFPQDGSAVALTAGSGDQPSHAAAGRRLWLQLVGDALAGHTPAPVEDGRLTAGSLHSWTSQELPRAIRKAIAAPEKQTPRLFGPPNLVLAAITPVDRKPAAKLSLKQLRRIVFRGESRGKLKDLAGYQKSFKPPEAATPSAQKWTYRMAAENLRSEIEDTFNALREILGYKRKDLESSIGGDGFGSIRTPGFDYSVSVSLDPDDPSLVIWRREVSHVADLDTLRSDGFRRVFARKLDTLQFEFDRPIDIEGLVDRIEEDPPPGTRVRVASDSSACDIMVQGFAGRIHVEPRNLRIEGPPGLTPESLVEQFFAFQARFGGQGRRRALGGRS